MVCTTSIGPGATNMVTAAALAHVNRLPVLFIPGDIFANRAPDPVLVQAFGETFINYFTRIKQSEITRHEQAEDKDDWQRRE